MSLPKIEIIPLERFRPQTVNANGHTARGHAALGDSIQADGWIGALTVAADAETFDGSDRLEVAAEAGFDEAIVLETDGSRPVIIKRTDIPSAADPRAQRLGIAANRVAQLNLAWKPMVLAEMQAAGIPLAQWWHPEELAAAMQGAKPTPGKGGDEFTGTPDPQQTRVQPGDLWAIGPHRLLCGDSTNAGDVARLMDGARAGAVVTDSPYGINRDGITNDDPEGLRELFDGVLTALPADNAVVINFQSPRLFPEWLDAIRAHGHKVERALWFYDETDITYPWRGWLMTSQMALVSSIGKPQWPESGPYHHDCYIVKTAGQQDDSGGHTTAKPLDVVEDLVAHTMGLLYEPFAGSGTTLIAAHRTGRLCYGMELEPQYCDVILRRAEAEGIGPIARVS